MKSQFFNFRMKLKGEENNVTARSITLNTPGILSQEGLIGTLDQERLVVRDRTAGYWTLPRKVIC